MKPRTIYLIFAAICIVILLITSCRPAKTPEVVRVEQLRAALPFTGKVYSSESMKGFKPGDPLRYSVAPYSAIQPGDPIYAWYTNQPRPIFHWAVRKVYSSMPPHDRWLVQGDNNKYPDTELLTEETYIGRWDKVTQ